MRLTIFDFHLLDFKKVRVDLVQSFPQDIQVIRAEAFFEHVNELVEFGKDVEIDPTGEVVVVGLRLLVVICPGWR